MLALPFGSFRYRLGTLARLGRGVWTRTKQVRKGKGGSRKKTKTRLGAWEEGSKVAREREGERKERRGGGRAERNGDCPSQSQSQLLTARRSNLPTIAPERQHQSAQHHGTFPPTTSH